MPFKAHLTSWKASLRPKVSPAASTQDATTSESSQPEDLVTEDSQVKDERPSDTTISHPKEKSSNESFIGQLSEHDDLWDRAYQQLKARDEKLILKYEACLAHHDETRTPSTAQGPNEMKAAAKASSEELYHVQMRALLQAKIKDDEAAVSHLHIGGSNLVVRDQIDKAVRIIVFAKDFVSAAVASEPHAALAWTGVCVLLPLILQPSEQRAANLAGLEEISDLVNYYNAVEVAYWEQSRLSTASELKFEFERKVVALFTLILGYQARTVVQLSAHFPKKAFGSTKETWNTNLDRIRSAHRSCQERMVIIEGSQIHTLLDEQKHRTTRMSDIMFQELHDLKETTRQTHIIAQDERRLHDKERLQKWLGGMDQSNVQAAHRKSWKTGTGEWLLQSDAFNEWCRGVAPCLWLNGTVGCGKSVLCSSIIEYLQKADVSDGFSGGCELAYAYISWDDQTTHELGTLIRSFLAQLSENATISAQLTRLYKESERRVINLDDMTDCLMSAIRKIPSDDPKTKDREQGVKQTSIVLVLDALDEVPFGPSRDELLNFLLQMAELNSPFLRIVVSSRRERDIKERLILKASWRSLPIEQRLVSEDIGGFVRGKIAHHWLLGAQSVEIQDLITDGIVNLSGGIFRLAFLQMQELLQLNLHEMRPQDVENTLNVLPREMYDGYKRILQRIPKTLIDECVRALKCLAFCKRPLFIEEVVDACATDPEALVYFTQERRRHPGDLLAHLADLVTVEPDPGAGNEPFNHRIHIVSLAHFSVREFFSLEVPFDNDVGAMLHTFQPQMAHAFLAKVCLAYIAQYTRKDDRKPGTFVFLDYAWHFWAAHVVTTLSNGNTGELNQMTFKLFNSTVFPILYRQEALEDPTDRFDLSQDCFQSVTGFLTEERLVDVRVALQNLSRTSNADPAAEPYVERYSIKESLPEEPRATRLLILQPLGDGNLDSVIECSTCAETLNNNPVYTALAYVWYEASAPDESVLRVNGALCRTGGGVVAAMKRLRLPNAPRVLWIDAICISMQDMAERSAQVHLMSDIYRSASEVVLWLGEEDKTSSSAMKVLQEARLVLTPMQSRALDLLFQRRLWSRVWIVQEIISAKSLAMLCGPDHADFDRLGPISSYKAQQPEITSREPRASAVAVQELRHEYQKGSRLELEDLLKRIRHHECSEPSDRIYAMLNLLPEGSVDSDLLKVDYTRSPSGVFARAAVYIMKRANSLDLLCQASTASESDFVDDRIANLPSWVPNFERQIVYDAWDPQPFNADGGQFRPPCIGFRPGRKTLLVKGFVVDSFLTSLPLHCDFETRLAINDLEQATGLRHGGSGIAYLTQKGLRSIGPPSSLAGDSVVILAGGSVPFILRETLLMEKEKTVWKLVGACYLLDADIMHGTLARDFTGDLMDFNIR